MGLGVAVSDPIRLAIASDVTAGLHAARVAAKYNVSTRTVSRILNTLRQAPAPAEVVKDWRSTINQDALVAVRAGVNCEDDPYKRGNLGIQWLKGTGLLMPDNVTQINNLYASMPADWSDEFSVPQLATDSQAILTKASADDELATSPTSANPSPAAPEPHITSE